jgi:hypothetical protein
MTVEQFRESLCRDDPPTGLDFALAGLWWDAKGDWAKAHESACRVKVRRDHGSTPICIARKAMPRMPDCNYAHPMKKDVKKKNFSPPF